MSFWRNWFRGAQSGRAKFRRVDWLEVEGRLRQLEAMSQATDQTNAKQVIIQADILVDSILKQASVAGETMGERLKRLRGKMDNNSYNHLWQAHKKRNELVHEPGSFVADWEKAQYWRYFQEGISALRGIRK